MDFSTYQAHVLSVADTADYQHEQVAMLGIGAHIGALLDAQQRYLRDAIAVGTSTTLMARELGEVLRWCAHLATHHHINLDEVALLNLQKVDARALALGSPPIPTFNAADAADIRKFQELALHTDQQVQDGVDPLGLGVPILGLAGEAGNLMVEMKKRYRGDSEIPDWVRLVEYEIGDLLWYSAALASHLDIDLNEIASSDVQRAQRSRAVLTVMSEQELSALPVLDDKYPATERFPRKLLLRFQEQKNQGNPLVTMTLVDASPNAYPDGPASLPNGKPRGFELGASLGDKVTNNSYVDDRYRYHDAIHLGFLAVMGWSPNLRNLLRLKRKSDPLVDENEDGARAIFAEEGLAAVLAKRADDYQRFANTRLVPEDLIDLITTVLEDLEVSSMPAWLWREAVSQGFNVMQQLSTGRGGYVTADLDSRSLTYSKLPPRTAAIDSVGEPA
ncbi:MULTISPECIES: hypothetical protein [unclassified Kribbella]|uniref:hypothetical protein n=1 Tax=unclassified Kribbella TaxID=2644121 RepID=UPI003015E433